MYIRLMCFNRYVRIKVFMQSMTYGSAGYSRPVIKKKNMVKRFFKPRQLSVRSASVYRVVFNCSYFNRHFPNLFRFARFYLGMHNVFEDKTLNKHIFAVLKSFF